MFARVLAVVLALSTPARAAVVLSPARAIEIQDVFEEDLAGAKLNFDARVRLGDRVVAFKINSFGGSIFDGLDFIAHVARAKQIYGIRTQCYVDGKAVSMGLVMLESSMCDERYAVPGAFFLGHNGSSSAKGTVEEIREAADLLAALNWGMSEIIGARLVFGPAGYRLKVAKHAWSFGAAEALAVGAIDAIVFSAPPAY